MGEQEKLTLITFFVAGSSLMHQNGKTKERKKAKVTFHTTSLVSSTLCPMDKTNHKAINNQVKAITRQDKTRQDKTFTRQEHHKIRQGQDKTRPFVLVVALSTSITGYTSKTDKG